MFLHLSLSLFLSLQKDKQFKWIKLPKNALLVKQICLKMLQQYIIKHTKKTNLLHKNTKNMKDI